MGTCHYLCAFLVCTRSHCEQRVTLLNHLLEESMSWYWIVLIIAVWLPGWAWGSRYIHNINPGKEAFGEKDFLTIVYALLVGLFWPVIGYIACVHMLYKRHVARTQKRPGNYPGQWMSNDVICIMFGSLAWPIWLIREHLRGQTDTPAT